MENQDVNRCISLQLSHFSANYFFIKKGNMWIVAVTRQVIIHTVLKRFLLILLSEHQRRHGV